MFHGTFSTLIIVLPGALVTPMQSIRGLFLKFVLIVSLGMFNAFVVIPFLWTIFPVTLYPHFFRLIFSRVQTLMSTVSKMKLPEVLILMSPYFVHKSLQ